ncbi:deaminase [Maribacter sp.]|uniref:deaminase n=1 Tax=Maribacter sp. TaxID=1897614 RepID=UPI0025C61E8C|nr:deaminase [Maribacter sp.]
MKDHELFMKECIALGKEALKMGNPPVGAIVVKNNKVIGKGLELAKSSKNIAKHAEIEAVKNVLNNGFQNLEKCALYTTHKSYLMCAYVLRTYKLEILVYGIEVLHIGGVSSEFNIMNTSNVPNWTNPPIIIGGVLKEECKSLSNEKKHNNG